MRFGETTQLALLEEQHLRDVGEHTTLTDSHTSKQLEGEGEGEGDSERGRGRHIEFLG